MNRWYKRSLNLRRWSGRQAAKARSRFQVETLEDRRLMDGSSPSLLFDFGYNSPVASGAIPINMTSYRSSLGYGWTSYRAGGDSGGTNPLTRDSNWGNSDTFLVDVPDGPYTVTPVWKNLTSQTAIIAEGQPIPTSSLSNFTVNVTGGQLTLNFQNYNVAGLTIAGPNLSLICAGPDQVVDEGTPVQFTGHAFTAVGSTFTWDFGDGATASGTLTPAHTYQDNGTYTATLTAKDSVRECHPRHGQGDGQKRRPHS